MVPYYKKFFSNLREVLIISSIWVTIISIVMSYIYLCFVVLKIFIGIPLFILTVMLLVIALYTLNKHIDDINKKEQEEENEKERQIHNNLMRGLPPPKFSDESEEYPEI